MAAPSATPAHRRRASPVARLRTVAVAVVLFGIAVAGGAKLAAPGPLPAPPPALVASPATVQAVPDPTPTPTPAPPHYVFPVLADNAAYAHIHEEYPAADILAPCGTPVVAAADGVVLEVNRVDHWDPATDDGAWRGGRFLSIRGDDGVRYYGAHFSVINEELAPGVHVRAGQPVGQVGTTGKSGACHLHFGLSPPCGQTGDWWNRRGVIWPWPYLDAWRAGTSTSAVPEITGWQSSHGCPSAADPNLP